MQLAAQHVEGLCRGGRNHHQHVLQCTQLQEALQARRAVLRALPFIAMRQQQGQAGNAAPLGFTGGDELVDHHLGAVGEVAELAFPDAQRVRIGGGEAVLVGHHRFFAQQRIDDGGLLRRIHQLPQRHVVVVGLLVVQDRVAVGERTATDVLADQAQCVAFVEQGGVGQVLGKAPVARDLAGGHLAAVVIDLGHARVQLHVFGNGVDQLGQFDQLVLLDLGRDRVGQLAFQQLRPIDEQRAGRRGLLDLGQLGGHLTGIELLAVGIDHRLAGTGSDHACLFQLLGVHLAGGRVLADHLVHQRLGDRRLVGLVVAPTAVAHQVDDHVLGELLAELEGQLRGEHHRFRIIAVHVQHRGGDHLRHVGGVARGARVQRVGGGEADLVVDHDVHGAADGEAAGLRHLEQLHDHALAREGRIAVDQDRHDLLACGVLAALLARTHGTGHDRVGDFQVRRVERQRQVHRAAVGSHVGREAHVVLHVAGRSVLVVLELAFELVEQLARVLAEGVDQHVQTAAVGHADHHVLDAILAGAADDGVHHRDQRVAAFQREALLADVLGVQVALQAFGRGQALQGAALGVSVQLVVAAGCFQLLVDPLALLDLGDVHELRTDRAGVGRLQACQQVAQLHARLATDAAGAELAVEVGIGQAVERQAQVRGVDRRGQAQRIEAGVQVATRAVGGDQTTDIAFTLVARTVAGAGLQRFLGRVRNVGDDGRVRNVACFAALEAVEVGLPFGIDTVRGDQVLLVQVLDIGGVAAGELRRLRKLLQLIVHDGGC